MWEGKAEGHSLFDTFIMHLNPFERYNCRLIAMLVCTQSFVAWYGVRYLVPSEASQATIVMIGNSGRTRFRGGMRQHVNDDRSIQRSYDGVRT